jgi:hypothetical protein
VSRPGRHSGQVTPTASPGTEHLHQSLDDHHFIPTAATDSRCGSELCAHELEHLIDFGEAAEVALARTQGQLGVLQALGEDISKPATV